MGKTIVLGAGAAGLAFSVSMASKGQKNIVLYEGEDVLGGKAHSREIGGRTVEHGIHFIYGFYFNFIRMLDIAGIPRDNLIKFDMETHMYEPSMDLVHLDPFRPFSDSIKVKASHLISSIGFLGIVDKLRFLISLSITLSVSFLGPLTKCFDKLNFSRFFALIGMPSKINSFSFISRLFEPFGDRPFSSYHMLSLMKAMNSKGFETGGGHAYLLKAGYSKVIWEPIGKYLLSNGIKIQRAMKLKSIVVNQHTDKISIKFHNLQSIECDPREGDQLVSALPPAVIENLVVNQDGDPVTINGTPRENLSSLTMMVYTKRKVKYRHISNLPLPFHDYTDMKPFWDEVRTDPDIGSLLYFNGFENEDTSKYDEEVISKALGDIAKTSIGDLRSYGIVNIVFHRNNTPQAMLACFQPGEHKERETPTIINGLHLIGDWTQNKFPLPCMESAVESGNALAEKLLSDQSRTQG